MNKSFLEANMWRGEYVISPYTSSSFYATSLEGIFELVNDSERRKAVKGAVEGLVMSGEVWLLPHRLGILQGDSMASTSGSGRARTPMIAQLKASFTKAERSPYKVNKPYEVQTGIWKVEGSQSLYYGSLGISGASGRVERDNGDLLIIRTTDWKRLEIFIFRGLAGWDKQLDYLPSIVSFVKGLGNNKGGCFTTPPLNNQAL
ncbi:MAG: hypothetical protein K5850_06965 [Bacteroidales bacterium]|nr:hypothetical protein [Bacteroidales bacterium]